MSTSEQEPDVEPSGATGFEETDRDVRRATNEETTIDTVSNIVSGIFDTDNFLKTQAEVAQVNKEAQEDVGKISSTVAYETAAAVPQIAFNLATIVAPETIEAIKARNKRLIEDYGSLDSAYDLLRSGEITKDILNRERDAFIQSGNKIGLVGMQEGGPVNQMPEPTADAPLQIDYRMANPEVYQGSTLGVVRQQAGALRDSIDQDTANKARKALQLLKLEGILKGEKVESPGLMPQIPSAADSSRLRDMLEYFKMQTMQNGSRP